MIHRINNIYFSLLSDLTAWVGKKYNTGQVLMTIKKTQIKEVETKGESFWICVLYVARNTSYLTLVLIPPYLFELLF